MTDYILFVSLILCAVFALLYQREKLIKEKIEKESRQREIATAKRIANAAQLNGAELVEIIAEQTATATIESNKWQFEMPYGKWATFDEVEDAPPARIRGFWYNAESCVIGVKMPKGSRYEMHYHDWKEILIGIEGEVSVQIEMPGGEIVVKRLSPDVVIEIPAKVNHAVLTAKGNAEFLCVWGQPVN